MKTKIAILMVCLLIAGTVPVSAYSGQSISDPILNGLNDLLLFLGLTPDSHPEITNAFSDKTKYLPGDKMLITAAVEDDRSVKSVSAEVEFENGKDSINLILITGDNKRGTWQGAWTVHDTVGEKTYTTRIVVSDTKGQFAEKTLEWIDPNPGHAWNQMDCDNNLCVDTINGGVGIGTMTIGTSKLKVAGMIETTTEIKIGDSANTCDAGSAGIIKYNGWDFQACKGDGSGNYNWYSLTSPSYDPTGPLYGGLHSQDDCTNAGGSVQALPEGGVRVCMFNSTICSPGWTPLASWTVTTPKTGYCACYYGSRLSCPCTTGSHAWANLPPESCCGRYYDPVFYATITYIGCY